MFSETINIQKIVLEKFAIAMVIFTFSFGILVICGWSSLTLGTKAYAVQLWSPLLYSSSMLNILIVGLICLARYYDHKYRNYLYKIKLYNQSIFYLLCLPTVVVVIFMLALTLIKSIFTLQCTKSCFLVFNATSMVYFIFIMILLVHTNDHSDYGEAWIVNFINFAVILISIVSLIFYIAYNTSLEQILTFSKYINISMGFEGNCTILTNVGETINNLWNNLKIIMYKSITIFGLSSIVFLLKPALRNYNFLQKHKLKDDNISIKYIPTTFNRTKTIIYVGFLITFLYCLFFLIINILLRTKTLGEKFLKVSYIMEVISIISMIVLSIIMIKTIKTWPHKFQKNIIFNELIIWIGLHGQMVQSFAMIAVYIYFLMDNWNLFHVFNILKCVLKLVQNIVQSILESILIEKQWKIPFANQHVIFIVSAIFILGNNIVLGLTDFAIAYNNKLINELTYISLKLFVRFYLGMGNVFGVLQRVYGSLIFGTYIRFICKK